MRKAVLQILIIGLFSCTGRTANHNSEFTREISRYDNGDVDLLYKLTQDKARQLKLDAIENGYDSIKIRVWYNYSLINNRKLLVLSNRNGVWSGTLYKMTVNWDPQINKETIETIEKGQVVPRTGWANFINKLYELQILTLPDMDDIQNLRDNWLDGVDYNVEIATKNQYRFYEYHMPDKFQDEFWQAKNMMGILNLIQDEFEVDWELK